MNDEKSKQNTRPEKSRPAIRPRATSKKTRDGDGAKLHTTDGKQPHPESGE